MYVKYCCKLIFNKRLDILLGMLYVQNKCHMEMYGHGHGMGPLGHVSLHNTNEPYHTTDHVRCLIPETY